MGGSCLLGSTDRPVTKPGREQLIAATTNNPGWDRVVSSPLLRCSDFAIYFAEQQSLPITLNHEWREICFGEWDGKTYEEIHNSNPDALSAFWDSPLKNTPPGGEPLRDFASRIQNAWQGLINTSADQHVLLVTHSGVIRQVLAHILEIPETSTAPTTRIHTPYASLTRIEVYTDEQGKHWPRLMFLGAQG